MRRVLLAVLPMIPLANCVAPSVRAPVAAVPPPVTISPTPAPLTPAAVEPDAVEPGIWSYVRTTTGSSAQFGPAPGSIALAFDCGGGGVTVRMLRLNPSAPATNALLRASTMTRTVAVTGGGAFGVVRLTARDPILDALAFSRGKFGISVDGRERWYPAWPEVTRVIEDCRG